MANPLLEFVLSLVRDPEAAARYAANPEQAIAEAHLTDVTRVDVNSLIPVVSESVSAGEVGDNVWTSGQAVAAFDAFGDELPAKAVEVSGDVAADHPVIDPGLDTPARADADSGDPLFVPDSGDLAAPAAMDAGVDVGLDRGWDGDPFAQDLGDAGADLLSGDAADLDFFGQ